MRRILFTLLQSEIPNVLSKTFKLVDNELKTERGGVMIAGTAQIIAVASLEELQDVVVNLKTNQALCYGIPKNVAIDEVRTVRPRKFLKEGSDAIARSNRYFGWPEDNPGIFMIDYDPQPGEVVLNREELVERLMDVLPELKDLEMLWVPSSSSFITNVDDDVELTSLKGQRVYFVIDEPSDIPRIGEILFKRLWLKGLGTIIVGSAGQMLIRSTIDRTVYQPCRLDFAAGANCEPPLEQRKRKPFIFHGNRKCLVSFDVPVLTPTEENAFSCLVVDAKSKVRPEADIVRKSYVESRILEFPVAEQKVARQRLERVEDSGELFGDFALIVSTDETVELLTVSEILRSKGKYDKARTQDPIEPTYNGGEQVGILNLSSSSPNLYSFAHGGKFYQLHSEEASLPQPLNGINRIGQCLLLGRYKLPWGYSFDGDGIVRIVTSSAGDKQIPVISHEIAITHHLQSLRDKKTLVRITFRIGNEVSSVIVPREVIASNEITSLAAYGIHINSFNAREVMRLLMETELINKKLLPTSIAIEQLGWLKIEKEELFILGNVYIKGGDIINFPESFDGSFPFKLYFADNETERIVDAMHSRGSLLEWEDAAKTLNPYPYVKIAIIATCISPLLEKFNKEGFTIHFGYPTSAGKSTTLKIAASTMGHPEQMLLSWNATRTSIERRSAAYNVLPLLLDETKSVSVSNKKKFIREIIYQHSLGQSKGRGTLVGLRQSLNWRSVLISTGEANLLSMVGDGGIKARVLDLAKIPFNKQDKETADFVDSIIPKFLKNYGHALPNVISHIMSDPEVMQTYIDKYEKYNEKIRKLLPPGMGTRMSSNIAFIMTGGEIVNEALGLEWELEDIEQELVDSCSQVSNQESEGQRALEYFYGVVLSNGIGSLTSLIVKHPPSRIDQTVSVVYKGAECGYIKKQVIAILHSTAKDILGDGSFEADAVFKEWKSRGWLDVYKSRRFEKQVRFKGGKPWCVCLNSKALKVLGHCDHEDESERFNLGSDTVDKVDDDKVPF